MSVENSDQTIKAIPERAKQFIQRVLQEYGEDLDFSEESIPKLDRVLEGWSIGYLVNRKMYEIGESGTQSSFLKHGYCLVIIPVIWIVLMSYVRSVKVSSEVAERLLMALGIVLILVILGVFWGVTVRYFPCYNVLGGG